MKETPYQLIAYDKALYRSAKEAQENNSLITLKDFKHPAVRFSLVKRHPVMYRDIITVCSRMNRRPHNFEIVVEGDLNLTPVAVWKEDEAWEIVSIIKETDPKCPGCGTYMISGKFYETSGKEVEGHLCHSCGHIYCDDEEE